MEIINIPVNSVFYRGTDLELEKKFKKYIPNWYTFNIIYACMYVKKEYGAINIYEVIKPIKLLNITKTKLKDLSNIKDINVGKQKVSLRFLFSVTFGYGIEKNNTDFFKGNNLENEKYKGTQIYEFYKLLKEIDRDKKALKWFNKIKNSPSKHMVKNKLEFNRISDGGLDKLFLDELRRYKKLDGYYAPKIKSNWSVVDCKGFGKSDIDYFEQKCKYLQYEELAIFNVDKLQLLKTVKNNIINTCKILSE